ncbi:MAG: hypothetical protein K1W40_11495 [Schaedlerella sp.]|uniref:hypothetical protein n=1 Tax=Schaedlerella sp. TaxID=2676057 RepID=UPI00260E6E95|nr:hypothetical protein [uncultured Schaedlerella sp.]
MLDVKRIRLMARMAQYEKNDIRKDMKISTYYKKDYVSLNTLITILWMTVGYGILAALLAVCFMDELMENLTITKVTYLGVGVGGGYIALLIIYIICANVFYRGRHNRAKQRVRKYYRDLSRLGKMEVKEKKKV